MVIIADSARRGLSRSCGCLKAELAPIYPRTHGKRRSSEYAIWVNMIARCTKETRPDYARYGGRGIKVCERWRAFENFYADMGPRPSPRHSLDRVDNDRNYEPGNVRWATATEQGRNQRSNRIVTYMGQPMTLSEACERAGLNEGTVRSRIDRYGWTAEAALTTPINVRFTRPHCADASGEPSSST